ncbi:hypothetical protein Hanom_Chr13g01204871 [Helianthus anomalus]
MWSDTRVLRCCCVSWCIRFHCHVIRRRKRIFLFHKWLLHNTHYVKEMKQCVIKKVLEFCAYFVLKHFMSSSGVEIFFILKEGWLLLRWAVRR